jgi:hypothetical protein
VTCGPLCRPKQTRRPRAAVRKRREPLRIRRRQAQPLPLQAVAEAKSGGCPKKPAPKARSGGILLVAQLRPLQPPQSKEARSGRQMPQALVRTVILGGGVAGLPAANPALQGRRPLQAPPAPPLKPVLHLCHSFRCLSHLMHAAFTVQRFSSTASSTHMTYSHLFCDSSGAARNGEHRPYTGFNSGKLHRRHQPVDSGQPQRHRPGKPRVPRAHPVATQMESPPRVAQPTHSHAASFSPLDPWYHTLHNCCCFHRYLSRSDSWRHRNGPCFGFEPPSPVPARVRRRLESFHSFDGQ